MANDARREVVNGKGERLGECNKEWVVIHSFNDRCSSFSPSGWLIRVLSSVSHRLRVSQ